MTPQDYNLILISLLGIVFTMLIGVLAWIGIQIHSKMDSFTSLLSNHINEDSARLAEIDVKLGLIEKGLHADLSALDRRVTVVETRIEHRIGKERNESNS